MRMPWPETTAAPGTHPAGSNRTLGERCHDALLKAAETGSEARRLKKLSERVLAQITLVQDGKSHAEREAKARCDMRFIAAEDAYVTAETAANIARAEADGLQVRFSEWQTLESTRRAEMQLR